MTPIAFFPCVNVLLNGNGWAVPGLLMCSMWKGLLSQVFLLMDLKTGAVTECFFTFITLVGLLSCVECIELDKRGHLYNVLTTLFLTVSVSALVCWIVIRGVRITAEDVSLWNKYTELVFHWHLLTMSLVILCLVQICFIPRILSCPCWKSLIFINTGMILCKCHHTAVFHISLLGYSRPHLTGGIRLFGEHFFFSMYHGVLTFC